MSAKEKMLYPPGVCGQEQEDLKRANRDSKNGHKKPIILPSIKEFTGEQKSFSDSSINKTIEVDKKSLEDYEYLRITDKSEIPPMKVFISIAGETIATGGDLVTFSGAVKAGKSSTQDPIIASSITIDGVINDP